MPSPQPNNQQGNNADRIRTEERRHQVFQLKLSGATNQAIALQLGVSPTQVNLDYHRHIGNVRRDDAEAINIQWALHMERYDRLLHRWWEVATTGDHEEATQATTTVLRIMERMEKISGLIPDRPLLNFNIFQQNTVTTLDEAKSKMDNYLPIIREALAGEIESSFSTQEVAESVIEGTAEILAEEEIDFDELLKEG